MESVKKWLAERSTKKNGLYVHYSPPKLIGVASEAQLRQWARGGSEGRLERAVLAGQGRRLLAVAEALPLSHHLPTLVAKCDALHAAVERGSLAELQELLDSDYNRRKYIMCRDEAGVGLLHKAVFYDFMDIAKWLVAECPELVHQKDSEGRTPLHYAAVCRDEPTAAALLEGAGASRGARDASGRTPAHYRGAARTQLALPLPTDMSRETTRNPPGLVIKRHNIRIWCHDCDMAKLQRVVWEGHGSRLLSEVSSQPVVKKFLEAVPYIMNTIRDIHSAVIQNDLEGLMKHSGDPVPPQALSSRDGNNMTVMHKAAGLGHGGILKYIAERYPQGINDVDNDGRTPLHYAAAVKDEQHTYNTLVGYGADEGIVDNKNKTPGYYINRPQEIDKNLFKALPDAPRTASSAYPNSWDWKLLDTEVIAELHKKSRKRNLKASTENISSKNLSNTISESTDNHVGGMKNSSTRDLIKDLPDLDDTSKPNVGDVHIPMIECNRSLTANLSV
ncbi:serine/threonine-protein phosphatase 6 regulatory ankyrin repeat subunit A [Ostrinia furnacalis]|uniref:serine/threonine-protein phosphatase 6 regulatory ankyrin repeat subunit A n=1 Tax=Ostrinia furnacalis TaxID=93504 RepID=UPI00103E42C4|nr:serine/threonine-protein phosphatase 6 regulatory ankyrin repeat subunit A [Ostrinia furnacalis]